MGIEDLFDLYTACALVGLASSGMETPALVDEAFVTAVEMIKVRQGYLDQIIKKEETPNERPKRRSVSARQYGRRGEEYAGGQ